MRELILAFKKRGADELDRPLADLAASTWADTDWPSIDAITAVPLTWYRRLRRGFNQSELLARQLARLHRLPYVPVLRRRHGAAQTGRNRSARLRLSTRTFAVHRQISGRVVLVDDVMTTGATATACTRAILAAGAREVYVLTLARTLRSGRIP